MYPKVASFNIDQTIQLVSDQFEINVNSAQPFIDRDSLSLVNLSTGLIDAGGDPALIRHITAGKIDEIELRCGPTVNTALIRGRDASSRAADSAVFVTYMTGGRDRRLDLPTPPALPAGLQNLPGIAEPIVLPGTWTAASISADLASRVGLGIAYGAYDYVLREDVTVSGSALQAIQQLVAPFSQFERSKVDIWVDGTTLVVKPRNASGPVDPINVFDVYDARITDLLVRTKFLDNIRAVRLTGMPDPANSPCLSGRLDRDVVTTDEIIDGTGTITSRIVERRTLRIPDDAELYSFKETYLTTAGGSRLNLAAESETFFNRDILFFDANCGILGNPKLNSSVTIESALDEATGSVVETVRKTIKYTYDGDGFMRMEETTTEKRNNSTLSWDPDSRTVKTWRRPEVKMVQTVVASFGPDENSRWIPIEERRTTASGQPPGGPGRAPQGNVIDSPPVIVAAVIDNVPGARDVSYSNPNLTKDDLGVIQAQASASSGAKELEVNFTAANVPWLRRGQRMALTGLLADDGTPIPLQSMLVTEVRTEFINAGPNPTSLSMIKAVWWEDN